MSLFINYIGKSAGEKSRIKRLIIIILIFFPIIMGFNFFNKNLKSKKVTNVVYTPSYNFTPTPTITPVLYPQLFYFKTKIGTNLKLPSFNTRYILSGNNDNKYKYWYILITSPASDDITFFSYMFELGETAVSFEHVGNEMKNDRYKFVRGLLE